MNIHAIANSTIWHTVDADKQTVRLASPFTFGNDGTHITFSVLFPTENHFFITDFCEHVMLAESLGAKTSKDKYQRLNLTTGVSMASFNEDGEITATGHIDDLQFALFDCAKLALALSFQYEKWLPKLNQLRFRSLVETLLYRDIDESKIIKSYSTIGISGHPIQFPFAIRLHDGKMILIETVPLNNQKIDWTQVYQAHGKFADNKRIDENSKRLTIFENGDLSSFGQASTLLADVCSSRILKSNESWSVQRLII